jgi:N-acetylmuramoyl-L-alanine amidase CwlA
MKIHYKQAKPISYGGTRALSSVRFICIHNTGNKNDTSAGNASFFSRYGDGNKRNAGAHFFIDQDGVIYQTIKLDRIAWAVGDPVQTTSHGAASLHGKCTNTNSVSIELCDIVSKNPSKAMIKSTKEVIAYIRQHCKNAKTVCRHYDVSGKDCPERMTNATDTKKKRWLNFLEAIGERKHAKKSAPAYPTKDLQYGDTGEQVKRLQRCLNKIDDADLKVDGSFGKATLKAVNAFKKKHGLNATSGKVGTKTRALIKNELEKKKK